MEKIKIKSRAFAQNTNIAINSFELFLDEKYEGDIIKKLNWDQENQIVLNVNSKKKIITLELKTDNA